MDFTQPVSNVIRQRASYRTYREEPIAPAVLEALRGALEENGPAPFESPVRLVLLDAFDSRRQGVGKLGTYGVIRGARNFIAGACTPGEHVLEDYGYLLERAVLVATDLGLQTCWLGGTLNREAFARAVGATDGEVVPAVAAVGYARKRRSLIDAGLRLAAGSKNRKAWPTLFFSGGFQNPLTEPAAGHLAPAFEAVRLAPSASNKQPWRLVLEANHRRVHFYLHASPGYQRMFAVNLQRIDLGIAMCHFDLVTRELGQAGSWTTSPPDLGRQPARTGYVGSWTGDAGAR